MGLRHTVRMKRLSDLTMNAVHSAAPCILNIAILIHRPRLLVRLARVQHRFFISMLESYGLENDGFRKDSISFNND